MPILDYVKVIGEENMLDTPLVGVSRQIEFGNGDIKVCPGLLNGENIIGSVSFFPQEPRQIGEHVDNVPNEVKGLDETPVRFIFEKVESIDVVIWALEEAKRFMLQGNVNKVEEA